MAAWKSLVTVTGAHLMEEACSEWAAKGTGEMAQEHQYIPEEF